MAVTNLLDRLAEEYEGNHPVEYRAQLAKLGKSIGNSVYSLGGGAKGVSARDIIRKDIKGNGVGVYPFDVLEDTRVKKRIDESKPWDYAIVDTKGIRNDIPELTFNDVAKKDVKEKLKELKQSYKDDASVDFQIVDNVKSNRQSVRKKRDLDEFKKAFEDVRAQRDHYFNDGHEKGDFLNYPIKSAERKIGFKADDVLNTSEKRAKNYYRVSSWQDWLDAKRAAKDAGQKLGRMFAEQNQREKNVYGNISKGLKPSTSPVPEGRYKYALGNQNHVYSVSPDEPQNDWMNLNPEYHGQPALTNSGHQIHWRKDGTPIIDAYTWTQIPNIEKIKKTGYLAVEGSDTENFHPGTKGQWTSDRDNTPMGKNYDNDMHVGEVGPNGENFNEELLHSRLPLSWYQNAPVIHQGPRGSSYNVDVIQARPNAPEVMIGEGDRRRLEKVATPAQFINHIPADKMREDWVMSLNGGLSIPGWHPNKKDYNVTLSDMLYYGGPQKGSMSDKESANALIEAVKKPEVVQKIIGNFRYNGPDMNIRQRKALDEYYKIFENGEHTPYEIIASAKNPPAQPSSGRMLDTERVDGGWNSVTNDSDFSRTQNFIAEKIRDNTPISRYRYGTPYRSENLLDLKGTALQNYFVKNMGTQSLNSSIFRVFPDKFTLSKKDKAYQKSIGLGNLDKYVLEKKSFKNYPESNEISNGEKYKYAKYDLEDKKSRRFDQAMTYAHRNYSDAMNKGDVDISYKPFNDAMDFTANSVFNQKQSFSFDDWFDAYKNSKGFTNKSRIQSERERLEPAVRMYLDELKKLPSDKELTREVLKQRQRKYAPRKEDFTEDRYKDYMKADSLDKVIGHTIGRRIGADRAKRGKKIF